MDTKTLRQLILEPDTSGNNIRALCFCIFSFVSVLSTGLTSIIRLIGGHNSSAWVHLILCIGAAYMFLIAFSDIRNGKIGDVKKLSYPFVTGGFIFGITALFFIDGGIAGGTPFFIVLAFVATPCFFDFNEAVLMLALEAAAYLFLKQ